MRNLFHIGEISSTHGLLGAFKIKHNFTRVDDILKFDKVYIFGYEEPFNIKRVITKKNSIILEVNEITSIDEAEELIGLGIYVDKDFMDVDDKLYKESELIDFTVYDNNDNKIGKVIEIIEGPSQDAIVITDGKEDAIVPFVKEFILDIDDDNKSITINVIEGLIPWL